MELLKHDILTEFPLLADKIHALKAGHPHFARLYEQCESLNKSIAQVEMGGTGMTDEALEVEKKKRLKLKDDIVQMLRAG